MSQFINGKPQDGMTGVSAELNDRPRKALGWKTLPRPSNSYSRPVRNGRVLQPSIEPKDPKWTQDVILLRPSSQPGTDEHHPQPGTGGEHP